ncbi:tetratricopeptide repeat protein [Alteromonas sp. AMM-1]|uniref:tetratricopeptide repeat protein n=1 Tax=Alteromonas sp. AMM-1 TaxID=3394233 RepID=UPI0039A6F15C
MKNNLAIPFSLLGSFTALCITIIAVFILAIGTAFAHVHEHDDTNNAAQTIYSPRQIDQLLDNSTRPDFDARQLTPVLDYLEHIAAETELSAKQRMFYARLLQHEHRFAEAQVQLNLLLEMNPLNSQARLLLANVALNQGNAEKAVQLCERLVGQTDLIVATTCLLEARMQQSPSTEHYKQLVNLTRFSARAPINVQTWLNEVLADMALYAEQPSQAITHCEETDFKNWPVSTWASWSKAKIALGEGQDILTRLSPYIENIAVPNDSMLLYLALAEQQVGTTDKWIKKMAQRVQLRELHNDTTHAAEVALYYLHLAEQPEQALTWATLNWENAKSLNDRLLLEQAKSANRLIASR